MTPQPKIWKTTQLEESVWLRLKAALIEMQKGGAEATDIREYVTLAVKEKLENTKFLTQK